MMHIDDCLRSVVEFMERPSDSLPGRTYNVAGVSFTPAEIADEIRKSIPDFQINYRPDQRQAIADSWPQAFDDSCAQRDWGWRPQYDLTAIVNSMLRDLRPLYRSQAFDQHLDDHKTAAMAAA